MNRVPQSESNMFKGEKIEPPTPEQAKKISGLSDVRNKFSEAVTKFRALLKDFTLREKKAHAQLEVQKKIFEELNKHAGDLEQLNVGEGLFSLSILSLSSVLYLHEEVNELRFQNVMLGKKIKELTEMRKSSDG